MLFDAFFVAAALVPPGRDALLTATLPAWEALGEEATSFLTIFGLGFAAGNTALVADPAAFDEILCTEVTVLLKAFGLGFEDVETSFLAPLDVAEMLGVEWEAADGY